MRQIFVDSRDRISGTPSSDFTIQLPSTLVLEGTHQARINDLRIPTSIPTISGTNNTIEALMGSTKYVVTIPSSQYDGSGLASDCRTYSSNSGQLELCLQSELDQYEHHLLESIYFHWGQLHDSASPASIYKHQLLL